MSLTLRPIEGITDRQRKLGLRFTVWQGMTATAIYSVVNNGFLVAYALALGADNLQVGILAALPFVGQPFQIVAMFLVDRFHARKLIAMVCWAPSQVVWLLMALIPLAFDTPSGAAIDALLVLMAVRSLLVSFVTTSWNSWLRDLVPQSTLGTFFSRRLGASTLVAVAFGLGAAFAVQAWGNHAAADQQIFGYTWVLTFGAATLGLASVVFMGLVPEPRAVLPAAPASVMQSLRAPLQDLSFRRLIMFLSTWSFATSLAIPFFTVYMLTRLAFSLPLVIGLMALSQVVTAAFTSTWGSLADRYSFKTVLSLSGSLYLFVILGWAFTALPDPYSLTVPLVVVLLIFAGIAAAGVNLAVEIIGLKLAPEGGSTPYLVAASLATSVGAAIGPIVGGRLADFFSARQMSMNLVWQGPGTTLNWTLLSLTGFDFLFALSFIIGLPTLVLLSGVREQGEVSSDVVLDELFGQGQGVSRSVSLVPGLNLGASIPYTYLRHVPGVNVGIGATLYEVRAAVRGAMAGLREGRSLGAQLTHRLELGLRHLLAQESMDERGAEFAKEVAKGVVASSESLSMPPEAMAAQAVQSAATVVARAGATAEVAVHAAAQGAALGAVKAGADVGKAAGAVIEGARSLGEHIGISGEAAAREAAKGVVAAVEELNTGSSTSSDSSDSAEKASD